MAVLSALGCAGQEPEPVDDSIDHASLWVFAYPKGHTFVEDGLTVTLVSERPSELFYTLDGTPPTGSGAMPYTEPLTFDRDALLMFVGVDEDGIWSRPQTELYRRTIHVEASDLDFALWFQKTILLFSPEASQPYIEQTLSIRSDGLQPTRISRITIGPNPNGLSFFVDGAFELVGAPTQVVQLAPNDELLVTVRFHTTETIRSSALIVESNNMRAKEGKDVVELWGRIDP